MHATISPLILPCVHIAEDLRAPPLELGARPPVLTPVPFRRTHSSQRPHRLHYCLSGPWCLAFRDCRQSKDTQHKVHRHQQVHLRTCHSHWHKPTEQATSPLKFEPHMDRQRLIVCDPLTFVLDAPTDPYESRPTETQTNNTSHVSYLMSPCQRVNSPHALV